MSHKHQTILFSIVLNICCWACPSELLAQSQPAMSAEARISFDQGLGAAKAQQFEIAVADFENAFEADKNAPEIWFNLGLASSKLPGHELVAIICFEAYLRRLPETPKRTAILDSMAQLEAIEQGNLALILGAMTKILPPENPTDCSAEVKVRSIAIEYARLGLWQKAKDLYQSGLNRSKGCTSNDEDDFAAAFAESGDANDAAAQMTAYRSDNLFGNKTQVDALTAFPPELGVVRSDSNWGSAAPAREELANAGRFDFSSSDAFRQSFLAGLRSDVWGNAVCAAWRHGDTSLAQSILVFVLALEKKLGASNQVTAQVASFQNMIGDHAAAMATMALMETNRDDDAKLSAWNAWASQRSVPRSKRSQDIVAYFEGNPYPLLDGFRSNLNAGLIYCDTEVDQPVLKVEIYPMDQKSVCSASQLADCLAMVPRYSERMASQIGSTSSAMQFSTYRDIVKNLATTLNQLKQIHRALAQ